MFRLDSLYREFEEGYGWNIQEIFYHRTVMQSMAKVLFEHK